LGQQIKQLRARWKVQYLKDNSWIDAYSFRENDTRNSGDPIVDTDGYVELEYGLKIPEEYQNLLFLLQHYLLKHCYQKHL
jgi:hypothetical protein